MSPAVDGPAKHALARSRRRRVRMTTVSTPLQWATMHVIRRHPQAVRFLALTSLAVLSTGCGRVGGDPYQPALNTPLQLEAGRTIGQTFDPAGPVSGIDVTVATFAETPDPDGILRLVLREVGDDTVRATADVAGADLEDGTWVGADLGTPVTIDGVALMELTWEGTTPLALWADTTLEGTAGIVNDPYAPGQLVLDGRPVDGDLAFRVTGPAGFGPAVEQVAEVARSTAARLRDEPLFTVLWGLAAVGSAVLAVTGLRRRT